MQTRPTSELQRKLRIIKRHLTRLSEKTQQLNEECQHALQSTRRADRVQELSKLLKESCSLKKRLEKYMPLVLTPDEKTL